MYQLICNFVPPNNCRDMYWFICIFKIPNSMKLRVRNTKKFVFRTIHKVARTRNLRFTYPKYLFISNQLSLPKCIIKSSIRDRQWGTQYKHQKRNIEFLSYLAVLNLSPSMVVTTKLPLPPSPIHMSICSYRFYTVKGEEYHIFQGQVPMATIIT